MEDIKSIAGELTGVLLGALDEHVRWLGQVWQRALYPSAGDSAGGEFSPPQRLELWLKEKEKAVPADVGQDLATLKAHYEEVYAAASVVLEQALAGQVPDQRAVADMMQLFSKCAAQTTRLTLYLAGQKRAVDAATGLRLPGDMMHELTREIARLDRKGLPFCVVRAAIDNYEAMTSGLSEQQKNILLSEVATIITGAMRLFDDAFLMGGGEFVIFFKQADMTDLYSAIDRIRLKVAYTEFRLAGQEEPMKITMSFGMTEPFAGDKADAVLQNAANALVQAAEKGNTVMQFEEMSPLLRYVRSHDATDA